MSQKDRRADRHDPETHRGVSVRLPQGDFDGLESARKAQGISRRQAIITAIREWIDRHGPDPSPESEK